MGASEATVGCLKWLANPARPPANTPLLVLLRSFSLLLTIFSATILAIATLFRPWKLASYRGEDMEIGVWTICRVTPKVYRCYDGWYEEHQKVWFICWRYLLMTTILILVVTFIFMCVGAIRKTPLEPKPWLFGVIGCLLAALCQFIAFILFYFKFEWEFAEDTFGWPIMGWNEETPDLEGFIETAGYPYIMAWVSEILMFIAAYMCFYTKCQEMIFISEEKKKKAIIETMKMLKQTTSF